MYSQGDPKYGETSVKMNPTQIINDLNICIEYLKNTFLENVQEKLTELIQFSFGFLSKGEYNENEINRIIQLKKALDLLRSNRKNCGRPITFKQLEILSSDPTYCSYFGSMISNAGIIGIEICNLLANPDIKASFCKFFCPKYIKMDKLIGSIPFIKEMKKKKNVGKRFSYIIKKPESNLIISQYDPQEVSVIEKQYLESELKKGMDSLDIPVIYAAISTLLKKSDNMIEIINIVINYNLGLKFLISFIIIDMRSQRNNQISSISTLINSIKKLEASKLPADASLIDRIKKEIRFEELIRIEQTIYIEEGLKRRNGVEQIRYFQNAQNFNYSNIYDNYFILYINYLKQKSWILSIILKELNDKKKIKEKIKEKEKENLKERILSSNSCYSDFYILVSLKGYNQLSKEYSTRIGIPKSIINKMHAKQICEFDENLLIQTFSSGKYNLEAYNLEDMIHYLLILQKNKTAELVLQKLGDSPQKVKFYIFIKNFEEAAKSAIAINNNDLYDEVCQTAGTDFGYLKIKK